MNSFFGIGLAELVLILLLAGLLLGPQHVRQIARKLGLVAAGAQRIIAQLRLQLNSELDALDVQEMRAAVEDVQQMQKQMQDMRREMQNFLSQNSSALQSAAQNRTPAPNIPPSSDTGSGPEPTIAPPQPGLPKAIPVPDDPEA
jgi:sec-independent protein translocase protein TatB